MAINFPSPVVNGNTYQYNGINYIYSQNGVDEGFWRVTTPGSVGIATAAEIVDAVEPFKYITPKELGLAQQGLPVGTVMLFRQNLAPIGWEKSVAHDDKTLRITSGNVGNGGSLSFSAAFNVNRPVSVTSSAVTLTAAQSGVGSHSHIEGVFMEYNTAHVRNGVGATQGSGSLNAGLYSGTRMLGRTDATSADATQSHQHSVAAAMAFDVQYIDLIMATKL